MRQRLADRWPFMLAPAVFVILDAGLTLAGQPSEYWADHSVVNEMAPMFNAALRASPWSFVSAIVLWIYGICMLTLAFPRLLALIVSVAFVTGHADAAAGWLLYCFGFSYWTLYWYHPMVAAVIVAVCAYAFRHDAKASRPANCDRSGVL